MSDDKTYTAAEPQQRAGGERNLTREKSYHAFGEELNSIPNEQTGIEQPNLNPQLFVVSSRKDEEARSTHRRGSGETTRSADEDGRTVREDEGVVDEETYPEGGRHAWLVVLGSWMAMVAALGTMNAMGTFQAYVSTHQLAHLSQGQIGWIFSVYAFLAFFLGVYIGPMFDKYGPRWFLASGTASLVTSLMLFSVSTQYWHFLLSFGLLGGLGTSLLFTPPIAAVGHFFKTRRGFATGIAATGGSIGGIIFPLMLQRLFATLGWGWAIRIQGFVCLALCLVANCLVRSRLPPDPKATAHPDPRIFKQWTFTLATIGIFLFEFGLFIPLAYLSVYALDKGHSESFSFQIITVMNAASVVGRLLPGWYADIIGAFNANIISVVITIIALFGVWLPPIGATQSGLIAFAVMFGFASGSNISLTPVCIGKLCKTQHYGRYYATCYTIVSLACLVGIPIAGEILQRNGGEYWGLITFVGGCYVGSFFFLVAAKGTAVGWKIWTRF